MATNMCVYVCVCVRLCTKSLQSWSESLQLYDCSPPGSSVHGILQARILEWICISFSRGSSQGSNPFLMSSLLASRFFTVIYIHTHTHMYVYIYMCVFIKFWKQKSMPLIYVKCFTELLILILILAQQSRFSLFQFIDEVTESQIVKSVSTVT